VSELDQYMKKTTFSLEQNVNDKFKEDVLTWNVDVPNFVYNISPLITLMRVISKPLFGKHKLAIAEFDDNKAIISTIKGVEVATISYTENSIFITSRHTYKEHGFFQEFFNNLLDDLIEIKPTLREMYSGNFELKN